MAKLVRRGDPDFPPINQLMARERKDQGTFTDQYITLFVKGRDNNQFGPVMGVFGLTGTGKSALWALLWSILAVNPRFKLCLYKCSQGLYDMLRKKWTQYSCPGDWPDRVYRAMNINEIKPDSFVVCDEGLLGIHALTALRTEMRKFGGFLGETRQKGCPVFIGAQTETIVAEVRRHMRIVHYKNVAVLASRREVKDPVELEYLSWLQQNEGREFTLVRAGYMDLRGMGILHIQKVDLDEAIPWFDVELSTYMRNENADVEAAWKKEILTNIISIADNFFTDCKEPGVTPGRLLKCKAGWLRSYYERYDPDFLEYLGPYVTNLANQITFVAKRLAWEHEDKKLPLPVAEVDLMNVQKDSLRQFVYDYLKEAGANYFGVPPETEWLIVSEFAEGVTQRDIVMHTKRDDSPGLSLAKVNAICQFYDGKVKQKRPNAQFAPQELQIWKLYERWDCSKTGSTNGGDVGEVDNFLPDGRAGTCKCHHRNVPTLTFSIVNDFGPENKWALEHGQDTIRVAIRNIRWIHDHPSHLDWIVNLFPLKTDAEGKVVDDLVKLDPERGFLRPDGSLLPVVYETAPPVVPSPPVPSDAVIDEQKSVTQSDQPPEISRGANDAKGSS